MLQDLTGRVALVTGAGSGLGRAIARGLASVGATVIFADVDFDAARDAVEGLESGEARRMDVTDGADVRQVVDRVVADHGALDVLVNSAGIRGIIPFLDQTVDEWQRTLDVNLTGTFTCAQAAARHMVAGGYGRIVNIASTTGVLALTKRSAYAASKAGVIGLTKAMAFELSSTGVTTNAVAPGPIETPLNSAYFQDEAMVAILRKEIPRGEWGQPEDVVAAVKYLASEDAGYVSGAVLAVDGGWLSGKGY